MNIPFSLKRRGSNPPLSAIFLSLLRVKVRKTKEIKANSI